MSSIPSFDVGVIGAGAWGTTLAAQFAQSGSRTLIWAFEQDVVTEINTNHRNSTFLGDFRLPQNLSATSAIDDFKNISRIAIVVPSAFFYDTVLSLSGNISNDTYLLSATKGFITSELKRPSECLSEIFPFNPVGVLSGPNLAHEIIRGLPAISLVASDDANLTEQFQKLVASERFRVYIGSDVRGTELGGALKNIMAIAAGMIDGLELGTNAHAALVTRGLAEMVRLGSELGAEPRTFYGISGIGDLVCTAQSSLSRNHEVGRRIAEGESPEAILAGMKAVAEGVHTTRHVHEYCRMYGIDLPITEGVYDVLFNNAGPLETLQRLMTRTLKRE